MGRDKALLEIGAVLGLFTEDPQQVLARLEREQFQQIRRGEFGAGVRVTGTNRARDQYDDVSSRSGGMNCGFSARVCASVSRAVSPYGDAQVVLRASSRMRARR